MVFKNRHEAGKKLATELLLYRKENPYVLAMPRGGVPIGFEVAEVLQAPLDVLVVRKIVLSANSEYGIGAIAEGGIEVLDEATVEILGIDADEISDMFQLEEEEIKMRIKTYRDGNQLPSLSGLTAVLVDDGMTTSLIARAAIEAVKKLNPRKIVFASPVCVFDTVESLKKLVDQVICLAMPYDFMAAGVWYKDFTQISDDEVVSLLKKVEK